MTAELTAKARHRMEVFEAAGPNPECAMKGRGHRCGGRLEADHFIECQRMTNALRSARLRAALGAPPAEGDALLLLVESLDLLIADGRNGWVLCHAAHTLKSNQLLLILPADVPDRVPEFAAEVGLLLDLERMVAGLTTARSR